jgi:uncharacterized protein YwgA
MQNAEMEVWDSAFLLALFACSQEPLDNLKIQKIVFISENEAREEKLKAANFTFFRYNLGPYSKELANKVRMLEDANFIDPETRRPTSRGEYVLDYLSECTGESPEIARALEILYKVCKKYRGTRSSRLVDAVYKMEVPVTGLNGQLMKVRDIPLCTDILDPERENLPKSPSLPQEMIDDLKVEFSLTAFDLDPNNPDNIKLGRAVMEKALSM